MSSWTQLGSQSPRDLVEARLEMHYAVQLPAIGVGKALVPHREDDSHTAMTWLGDLGQWVGHELGKGLRAGLRPALVLTVGTEENPGARQFAVTGRTLAEGLEWFRSQLTDYGLDASGVELDFHYEMPQHMVAEGATFRGYAAGFEEFGRYFANSALLLEEVHAATEGASAVLTWPHHFDAGLVLPGPTGDLATSVVGPGLSPGDGSYSEPYFYVNVWPRPENPELPELPVGHWHTEGLFAAILTATELLEGDDAGQEERARTFLQAAISAAHSLLS